MTDAEVHYLRPRTVPDVDGTVHVPSRRDDSPGVGGAVVGPVYEGELVEEPVDGPVLPATSEPVWRRPAPRTPVVPAWISDPDSRRAAASWAAGSAWHMTRFHVARSPVYAARLAAASPRGAGRAIFGAVRWASDAEYGDLIRASSGDGKAAARLAEIRQSRSRSRTLRLVAGMGAGVLVLTGLVVAGPGWTRTVVLAALIAAFGLVGRRKDKPIMSHAVVKPRFQKLTWPGVLRALTVAGLGGKAPKVKDGQPVDEDTVVGTPALVGDLARDGHGYRAMVDLPYGRTFEHAQSKRKELASGLDVAQVQLFLEAVPGSERRILMWVADQDPYVGKPNPSPLAKCPKCSVWEPQRLGVEPRGRVVSLPLIWNGFLLGSVPRQGKTFGARTLVSPGILDPYCDVSVLGAKGADWEDAEEVAVLYRAGEGDDDTVAYVVAALRRLWAECQARYDAIRALPRSQRPEGKITQELQSAGFRPHVIVLDEAQNVFGHRDSTGTKRSPLGKEALYLCSMIAKVGPAVGWILVLATQRPSAEVIPSDLRDILTVKVALKVQDRVSSDTILGDYRAARGIESASLINDVHRGVAVVVGVANGRGGDHQTIRTDLISNDEFARICQVGRQRRIDAGTLRGHAAGETDQIQVEVSMLSDVLAVWPGEEPKVWSEVLCERLAELRPGLYEGMEPGQLTTTLGRWAVPCVQVNRSGKNRRGYALSDVRKAAERAGTE